MLRHALPCHNCVHFASYFSNRNFGGIFNLKLYATLLSSINVEVLMADLSKPGELRVVEKRAAEDSPLELLVNNAGFGGYMSFIELDPDKTQELINLKVLVVTRLTRAARPGMVGRRRGSIVNVSSRLAFSGSMGSSQLPKRATYVGAHALINTFSQLLQSELEGTGVQVQALCPGVVQTEISRAGRYRSQSVSCCNCDKT
jgi:short-subunit dehydrogenase